ncbi:MAG: di-heme oxidoredictase family protein [Cyclobacteriaceae bacterium]
MSRLPDNYLFILFVGFFIVSCDSLLPEEPAESDLLDGPVEGLTPEQQRIFLEGDIAFSDEIFTPSSGLGPIFVASSCGSCHPGDGKGHPSNALFRFSKTENGVIEDRLLDKGGPQLQHRSIPGFTPEEFPADANGRSKVVAPAVTGLGFLAAVPDQTLLDLVEQQRNEGLVSGVVQWVNPPEFFQPAPGQVSNNGQYIGRFGKKAGAINVLQQVVNAYNQDMGITTDFRMDDPVNFSVSSDQIDVAGDPELPAATVNSVAFYIRTLKAPIPRNTENADVIRGKVLFEDINCSACHLPTMTTGLSDVPVFSDQEFHPYTDLLLHDMGPGLDDQHVDGNEFSYEWRTPPLWGIGLSKDAQGGQYFLMHDGRANSIEAAILAHGGEAEQMKLAFQELSNQEQSQLIKFLESL